MGLRNDEPSASAQVGKYMGVGMTWALSTLVFLLAGQWLGGRLGSSSLGAVVGAFVGASAGFWWLVRTLTAAGSSDAPRDEERRD